MNFQNERGSQMKVLSSTFLAAAFIMIAVIVFASFTSTFDHDDPCYPRLYDGCE